MHKSTHTSFSSQMDELKTISKKVKLPYTVREKIL